MLVRSSLLVAADMLVSGVLIVLPALLPFTEPFGVSVEPDVVASDLPLAACFAAFSASRFCFDADGAMVVVWSSFDKEQWRGREGGEDGESLID